MRMIMKVKIYSLFILIPVLLSSCIEDHLIKDDDYRDKVENKYQERKELFSEARPDLFNILETGISMKEGEALKFLLAYMPLSDIADYNGRFFLDNVKLALRTREEAAWGGSIPENIFLHYVLPVRVNNENLDSFRIAYFNEINKRIEGLQSISEAALEINHWCHEKVSYQPADERTSAPMATILSARGRCGEESTFTVAALRTAGIPARQIYTPRWAHSDDNHAWVEVWLDGEWKYLGACEPEPVLNRGWFTEPARRAMLTHTKAFGLYRGDENLVKSRENFAEINTLAHYARTKVLIIKVLDSLNKAVDKAMVEPRLYNYAEFYPLAELETDNEGFCDFETGLGDLLVWASKEDSFGFAKVSVVKSDTVYIKLGSHADIEDYYEWDIGAPVKHLPYPDTISQKLIMLNAVRLKQEDSIRQAYINSWMDGREAVDLALSIDLDTSRVKEIISRSMGNYGEISKFLRKNSPEHGEIALKMLEILADKDLRDTKAEVLEDHIVNVRAYSPGASFTEDIFINYVLNPRISHEIISPWRSFIMSYFDETEYGSISSNPIALADLLETKIKVDDDLNYYGVPISPEGVLKTGYADRHSIKILFIAVCRTYGIPARLEPGTNRAQFYGEDAWRDVYFNESEAPGMSDGCLEFSCSGEFPIPEYFIHFTLARFERGRYISLDYDYNRKVTEFASCLPLPPGPYMLVTGNRIDDSNILASIRFFTLNAGESKTVEIKLRKEEKPVELLGEIDLKRVFYHNGNAEKLLDNADNGLIISWIEHDREPSKHVLKDLAQVKKELDQLGCQLLFLSDPSSSSASYKPAEIDGLPTKSIFAFDENLAILESLRGNSSATYQLPMVLYADRNGKIYFMSEGYRIGTGEQLLKTIHKLE